MPIYKKIKKGIVSITKVLSVFNPQYHKPITINTSLSVKII